MPMPIVDRRLLANSITFSQWRPDNTTKLKWWSPVFHEMQGMPKETASIAGRKYQASLRHHKPSMARTDQARRARACQGIGEQPKRRSRKVTRGHRATWHGRAPVEILPPFSGG